MSDVVISISNPSKSYNLARIDDADIENEIHDSDEVGGNFSASTAEPPLSIVTPGELITDDPIWMKGHGVYFSENQTFSSVAGNVSRVNRLLSVLPLRGRYEPETGDHVIGRITEVGQKRWKVDIGAKQDAILMLGSVNLPGGILRRKSESDELQMRNFLKEGDLLNAEVQAIFNNGSASLHTRSLKYGKLRNGVFLRVPSSLVIKQKNHSFRMPGNINIVVGMNGFIWLSKIAEGSPANDSLIQPPSSTIGRQDMGFEAITRLEESSSWQIYSDKNDENISRSTRDVLARYLNVIKALAACELGITEPRIRMGYEASMLHPESGNLNTQAVKEMICQDIINTEKMRGIGRASKD